MCRTTLELAMDNHESAAPSKDGSDNKLLITGLHTLGANSDRAEQLERVRQRVLELLGGRTEMLTGDLERHLAALTVGNGGHQGC